MQIVGLNAHASSGLTRTLEHEASASLRAESNSGSKIPTTSMDRPHRARLGRLPPVPFRSILRRKARRARWSLPGLLDPTQFPECRARKTFVGSQVPGPAIAHVHKAAGKAATVGCDEIADEAHRLAHVDGGSDISPGLSNRLQHVGLHGSGCQADRGEISLAGKVLVQIFDRPNHGRL